MRLSQNDPRWKKVLIGQSQSAIGKSGCAITAACMIESKFDPKDYTRPDTAALTWVFVKVQGDDDPRYLNWVRTHFKHMRFVWRQNGYEPDQKIIDPVTKKKDTQFNILKKYMLHRDYGITLQVSNNGGGQHWLAGVGRAVKGWWANDPWNGLILQEAPIPYARITGWAMFARLP